MKPTRIFITSDRRAGTTAAFFAVVFLGASSALGADRLGPSLVPVTITVNSTSDVSDFGGLWRVGDLPGPDGLVSLREAAIASTHTPGPETIGFDIPVSDPGFIGTGFDIRIADPIEIGDDGTIVDASVQPGGYAIALMGSVPNTWSITGLIITSSRNTLRGLKGFGGLGTGLEIRGDGNRIEACSIRGAANAGIRITGNDNVVGGTADDAGCIVSACGGSGIVLAPGSARNSVLGSSIEANGGCGVEVDGTGNLVGGSAPGSRNVIGWNGTPDAQGNPVWSQIWLSGTGHVVKGNFIGVEASGTEAAGGSAKSGILVTGSGHAIGGSEPGAGNLISGQDRFTFKQELRPAGIRIVGGTSIVVRGNRIGTDAAGTIEVANQIGIRVEGASSDVVIGGDQPGEGNRIGFNLMDGLAVQSGERIRVSGNSVFENGLLAIDLGDDPVGGLGTEGVTANDPGDADAGANRLQNFPTITEAVDEGGRTVVRGTIDTPDPQTCMIELFTTSVVDPSGHGEGGEFQVRTTADASGSFTADLPGGLAGGHVAATATDVLGNTSEFSLAVPILGRPLAVGQSGAGFSVHAGPNPFRDMTRMWLTLPESGSVDLRVFDVRGQEVSTISAGTSLPPGRHAWTWNGRDRLERPVPAGIYYLKARVNGREVARPLIVLR
jgi:hypothetical protein